MENDFFWSGSYLSLERLYFQIASLFIKYFDLSATGFKFRNDLAEEGNNLDFKVTIRCVDINLQLKIWSNKSRNKIFQTRFHSARSISNSKSSPYSFGHHLAIWKLSPLFGLLSSPRQTPRPASICVNLICVPPVRNHRHFTHERMRPTRWGGPIQHEW
jgi:hypothetical protein